MKEKEVVLIIDDSDLNIALLKRKLKDKYTIESADSGGLGLTMAKQISPDIVLVKLALPDYTAHQIINQLKQNSATIGIPVILIASMFDGVDEDTIHALGAVACLLEGFRYQDVVEVVSTHIGAAHG